MFSTGISWVQYWNSLCTASALAYPLLPLCQISLSNRLLSKASQLKVQGKHSEAQGSVCWAFDQTSLLLQRIFITPSICKLPAHFTLCVNCVCRASLKLLSTADWCNAQATSSNKDRWIIYNQVFLWEIMLPIAGSTKWRDIFIKLYKLLSYFNLFHRNISKKKGGLIISVSSKNILCANADALLAFHCTLRGKNLLSV